ncbi:MAG: hypothetical protein RL147_1112 [Actinomycetota bacterium]
MQEVLPKAENVSASIPFLEVLGDLVSDSIKTAHITIDQYPLKDSTFTPNLEITVRDISKDKPTRVGTLELIATIPAATITQSSGLENAQIVGNALQVSVGAAGLGQALLVPKCSNNQLYFEIKSVSLFGRKIPADSLPADVQEQIKSKSVRDLAFPKELTVKSVAISSKGLSINLQGNDLLLTNLGKSF